MDRGAWGATVHGVTELDMTEPTHAHTHAHATLCKELGAVLQWPGRDMAGVLRG